MGVGVEVAERGAEGDPMELVSGLAAGCPEGLVLTPASPRSLLGG
jgi:hypothetical protein